jgi:hypothetical protein
MVERKSPVRNDDKCNVKGCQNSAERSLARDAAEEGGLEFEGESKRVHICKEHYKAWKKNTKKDREIGSLGH